MKCEYNKMMSDPEYQDNSWFCEVADGVVSQDLCERICYYCSNPKRIEVKTDENLN